jgi:hypothetical protein
MDLPTDVALRTSSYDGLVVARLADLHSDWIFSWPDVGEAPYMEEPALLAGEEFDALVFNALHGCCRQAVGCLRNALEILAVAVGLAVTNNQALYAARRHGQEISYGQAVVWLCDSQAGQQINAAAPNVVFGKDDTTWAKVATRSSAGTPTAAGLPAGPLGVAPTKLDEASRTSSPATTPAGASMSSS